MVKYNPIAVQLPFRGAFCQCKNGRYAAFYSTVAIFSKNFLNQVDEVTVGEGLSKSYFCGCASQSS